MPFYGVGSDFDIVKGKTQAFTLKVEHNRWHQAGTISNGMAIEETWERVGRK